MMETRRSPQARLVRFALPLAALSLIALPTAHSAKPKAQAPLETAAPASASPWQRYSDWPKTDWKHFNTLGALTSPAHTPPPKLDGPIQGDPKKGEKLALDRGRGGGCMACHILGPNTPTLSGNVGPDFSTIGTWGRTDEWLFNYTYDPRSVNPNSVMPPWGGHGLYTADEVKDIVAYLKTLTTPSNFKDPLEDPATRPLKADDRDNLDPMVNSAMDAMEAGKAAFGQAGPSGKSCASCHAKPEKLFKTWAAGMPKYEPRMKKVLGVEEFVTRHARATTQAEWPMQSDENIAMAIYLRYLANGTPIKVDTKSPGAKEANARGMALMQRKLGQLNFACTDCHELAANKWIRGQWLTTRVGQTAHFPTWRTSRGEIWDLRRRMQWCNVAIRANELPPDAAEYGDIELALTGLNKGQKLNAPGIRH